MITSPQIFIIYEPGMFGTFLANLFSLHEIFDRNYIFDEFKHDHNGYNAHFTDLYKDRLLNFHRASDCQKLLKKKEQELVKFFETLKNDKLGIHRLSSYLFTKIEYQKYFLNFIKIIIVPKEQDIERWAKRMFWATDKIYEKEYWFKNFKKKDKTKIPDFFKEGMSLKEKTKYLQEHLNFLNKHYCIDKKHDLCFDPISFKNTTAIKKLIDSTMQMLNLKSINLPNIVIKKFIDKNKKFFE